MIIGTAGHIDHGKTALVRALTGIDTDRLKEEKARGITIDLGFAYLPAPDGQVLGFVDVPGHEKFVHNMLAGAGGIDFVLLVVAADDGVMPQTREHLAIVDLLGIGRGLVAMTKVDLVAADRREAVRAEIARALERTGLAGSDIVPVSAVSGEGIEELRTRLFAQANAAERSAPRGPLPACRRSLVHADGCRHCGHRHRAVGCDCHRRSCDGQSIRTVGTRAFDPCPKSTGRAWTGGRTLRVESRRRGYCQGSHPPR